ncbi:MAG: cell wall-active antibiotics response protein [Actinobacteria bacterium]|nr:cell wall-active antibiotics response protein [Actinomycetota bacterium]
MRVSALIISVLIVILVVVSLVFLIVNAPVNKAVSEETKSFEVLYSKFPDASRLSVKATISFGSVRITESEDEDLALAVNFRSSIENLKPYVQAVEEGGELIVEYNAAQAVGKIFGDDRTVTHDIEVGGPGMPKKLKVDFSAGDIKLYCSNSTLINTSINGGVGNVMVDFSSLSGKEGKVNAKIDLGIGKVTIIVPRDAGFKYELDSGIGLVNFGSRDEGGFSNSIGGMSDDYAENRLQIDLKVNTGIGQVLMIEK